MRAYCRPKWRQLCRLSLEYTPYSKMAAVSDDLGRVARERGIEGQNFRCCAVSSKTFRTAVAWSRDQEDKIWQMPYLDLFFSLKKTFREDLFLVENHRR